MKKPSPLILVLISMIFLLTFVSIHYYRKYRELKEKEAVKYYQFHGECIEKLKNLSRIFEEINASYHELLVEQGLERTKVKAINDQNYFPTLMNWISKANKSIHVIMYLFKTYNGPGPPEREPDKLTEMLISKAEAGVDVRIVLESYVKDNQDTFNWLKSSGVKVKWDSKSHTTHDKLIIVDGYIVIIGSHNWSYYALTKNHEASILILDPETGKIEERYFYDVWRYG